MSTPVPILVHNRIKRGKSAFVRAHYNARLRAQDYKCAICDSEENENGLIGHGPTPDSPRNFARDHNHVTGQLRGLLCDNCNKGLGLFFDSVEIVEAAVKYLKRWRR